MRVPWPSRRVAAFGVLAPRLGAVLLLMVAAGTTAPAAPPEKPHFHLAGEVAEFAPGVASTAAAEVRLTLSPDGSTALWFSRDRKGGAGGYDIWQSRRRGDDWLAAQPVPFNSPGRDFDPAFSADGRFVYFCSDRAGGAGADDLFRVAMTATGYGAVEWLGQAVNSSGREFAPMLSADGVLLFSSDRAGGAGGHDLYTALQRDAGFAPAQRLQGAINTAADEFDATFLADGRSLVFARAADMRRDRVQLYFAATEKDRYDAGQWLPAGVNRNADVYGPMLDWSQPDRLLFSARGEFGMDLYSVHYRLGSD